MSDSPRLSRVAILAADPACAAMLAALMDGGALTANELALEAGVTPQTARSHLGRLVAAGLLTAAAEGRHRYHALAGPRVAALLRSTMGVTVAAGPRRVRPGPRDTAMREARVCYDHLAGEHAVAMLDRFLEDGVLERDGRNIWLAGEGAAYFAALGIDMHALASSRRQACRACLDWSVRRPHLAGGLGAAILERILSEKWAERDRGGRSIVFSQRGMIAFRRAFLGSSPPPTRK